MKKLITLLEKEMSEALDVYDNVNFKDNVVGKSAPSRDNINTALLQDVQTAAKVAGVKVDITTAVSGHNSGTRHESGNAVDIAIINNKAVSLSNRDDADKLVDALVKMGYQKNVESGNPKAVLTFGFKGHNNHVHVSNKDGQPSKYNKDGVSSPESDSTTTYVDGKPELGGDLLSAGISKIMSLNNENFFKNKRILESINRIKNLL